MTATKPNFFAKMKDLSEKEQNMVSVSDLNFLESCDPYAYVCLYSGIRIQ